MHGLCGRGLLIIIEQSLFVAVVPSALKHRRFLKCFMPTKFEHPIKIRHRTVGWTPSLQQSPRHRTPKVQEITKFSTPLPTSAIIFFSHEQTNAVFNAREHSAQLPAGHRTLFQKSVPRGDATRSATASPSGRSRLFLALSLASLQSNDPLRWCGDIERTRTTFLVEVTISGDHARRASKKPSHY